MDSTTAGGSDVIRVVYSAVDDAGGTMANSISTMYSHNDEMLANFNAVTPAWDGDTHQAAHVRHGRIVQNITEIAQIVGQHRRALGEHSTNTRHLENQYSNRFDGGA